MKRWGVAIKDAIVSSGGSQCGEDRWLINELNRRKVPFAKVNYIEVGANQPSQLSNTWQLYRRGSAGVLIEPDHRCIGLLRFFRPRDFVIQAAAGHLAGIDSLGLHQHTTSTAIRGGGKDFIGSVPIPVMRVDDVFDEMRLKHQWKTLTLLSIDTEGFDDKVLLGAEKTLKITSYVCVENWNNSLLTESLHKVIGDDFEIAHQTALNVIFRRVTAGES
jgi:FkbM family methyltransferase